MNPGSHTCMAKCSCPLSHHPSLISLCYFPLSFQLSQSTEPTLSLGAFHKQGWLDWAAMEGYTNGCNAFHVAGADCLGILYPECSVLLRICRLCKNHLISLALSYCWFCLIFVCFLPHYKSLQQKELSHYIESEGFQSGPTPVVIML